MYVHVFPTETLIRQVFQSPHFSSQGQEIRGPSFQTEEGAEHKDVVVATLLSQGLYSLAVTNIPLVNLLLYIVSPLEGCHGLAFCL